MSSGSGRPVSARRVVGAVLWGMAALHVVDGLRLRARRRALPALPAGVSPDPGGELAVDVVAPAQVEVDAATRAAVATVMHGTGADVVDLVPPDLPVDRAMQVLRRVDQQRLHEDPLYAPGGAHEALALHRSLVARLDGGAASAAPAADRGAMVRQSVRAQQHAQARPEQRLAPGLRASAWTPTDRWQELEELTAFARPFVALTPALVVAETGFLLAMAIGVWMAPAAGLAALAGWSLQPLLAFGGRHDAARSGPESSQPSGGGRDDRARRETGPSLRPPHLLRASLLRFPRACRDNLRLARAGLRSTRSAGEAEPGRPERRHGAPRPAEPPGAASPPPAETLFEPRRGACPWCEATSLVGRIDVPDLFQHKPGQFHLDECRACGHIFQNPALTPAGLDFYYDRFYDGVYQPVIDLATHTAAYQGRLDAVEQVTTPRRWLDVGTAYGHLCAVARQRWPDATFDGIDMGDGIEEALRRGWVANGLRGSFPDLASGLADPYDVVSMYHYLEHTRDPRAELAAAAKVLRPGGHLTIEVPDPDDPWARRLGRWWVGWLQPQHQHFLPCDNLVAALVGAGFDVVSVERGPASTPADLTCAVLLGLGQLVPPPMPWVPPPSRLGRVARVGTIVASAPVLAAARLADLVECACLGPEDVGNAYRLVARRT
jgi:SAM-dependent methyltransferase